MKKSDHFSLKFCSNFLFDSSFAFTKSNLALNFLSFQQYSLAFTLSQFTLDSFLYFTKSLKTYHSIKMIKYSPLKPFKLSEPVSIVPSKVYFLLTLKTLKKLLLKNSSIRTFWVQYFVCLLWLSHLSYLVPCSSFALKIRRSVCTKRSRFKSSELHSVTCFNCSPRLISSHESSLKVTSSILTASFEELWFSISSKKWMRATDFNCSSWSPSYPKYWLKYSQGTHKKPQISN